MSAWWDWPTLLDDLDPGTGGGEPTPPPLPEEPAYPGPNAGPPDAQPQPTTETITVYEWRTRDGACSVCAPLDGTRWEGNDGPHPPAHGNCRCNRVAVGSYERSIGSGGLGEVIHLPTGLPWR